MKTKVVFLVVAATQLFFGSQANAQDLMKCGFQNTPPLGIARHVLHCSSQQNGLIIEEASSNGGNCRSQILVGGMGLTAYKGEPLKFGMEFRIHRSDGADRQEECRTLVQWVIKTNKGTVTFVPK